MLMLFGYNKSYYYVVFIYLLLLQQFLLFCEHPSSHTRSVWTMSTVVDVRYVRWYVRYTFASYECIAYYSHILKRLSSCEWLCSLTALVELIDPVVFPLFKGPFFAQWLAIVPRRCGGFGSKTKRRSINTSVLFLGGGPPLNRSGDDTFER